MIDYREPTHIDTANLDLSDVDDPPPSPPYLLLLAVLCLAGLAGIVLVTLAEWQRGR